MSKRAQERVLLAQVGREIQANLRHMEQVLDAFFRDNGKRAELATLAKDSAADPRRAAILGLDEADRLLALCQAADRALRGPGHAGQQRRSRASRRIAVRASASTSRRVEQQRPDRDRLIAPLIAQAPGRSAGAGRRAARSVEDAVAELRAQLPRARRRGAPRAGRRRARARPAAEAREPARRRRADRRRRARRPGRRGAEGARGGRHRESGGRCVDAIADTGARRRPRSPTETQRLLDDRCAAGSIAELLEIYLIEAGEVLDSVATTHDALARNPGDREALATVRRGFHTLKGSGRMVGLTELGEIAYDAEQVHNRLLEEERPVTPAVLAHDRASRRSVPRMGRCAARAGRVTPDPQALHEAIRAVEAELPGRASVIGAVPTSVPSRGRAAAPMLPSFRRIAAVARRRRPLSRPLPTSPSRSRRSRSTSSSLPELGAASADASTIDRSRPARTTRTRPARTASDDRSRRCPRSIAGARRRSDAEAGRRQHAPLLGRRRRPPRARPGVPTRRSTVPPSRTTSMIGDVTLSASLWTILCDEADQHLATLEHELVDAAVRSRTAPSARDGPREPHVVRHPSHRRISA